MTTRNAVAGLPERLGPTEALIFTRTRSRSGGVGNLVPNKVTMAAVIPYAPAFGSPNMSTIQKPVTNGLFDAYLLCPRKPSLIAGGVTAVETDYIRLVVELYDHFRHKVSRKLQQEAKKTTTRPCDQTCSLSDLRGTDTVAFNVRATSGRLQSVIDAVTRVKGRSRMGPFHYEPTLFCPNPRIGKAHRLALAYRARVLGEAQDQFPERGSIVFGPDFSKTRVHLSSYLEQIRPLVDTLLSHIDGRTTPALFLNDHCEMCQFKNRCRKEAEDEDNLSLLKGISQKEVSRHNSRGIFTVTQLSYTFRPRRRPKRAKPAPPSHSFALRALSRRENKIHIHGDPQIPTAATRIFLDIESVPHRDFYYLIGMLEVGPTGKERFRHFWASDEQEEQTIFAEVIRLLDCYDDYILLHYGDFETKALRRLGSRGAEAHGEALDRVLERSVNFLSIIFAHIYFPTWSNGLKEIASFLGFKWSHSGATGLDSIVWRQQWDRTQDANVKEKLIQYNRDDCQALRFLTDYVTSVTDDAGPISDEPSSVARTSELLARPSRRPRFGKAEFSLPEFEIANRCAYFDYQRDRVFVRTSTSVKRSMARKRRRERRKKRPNKPTRVVELTCDKCVVCDSGQTLRLRKAEKTVIDLRFLRSGVKKEITRYVAWSYQCQRCREKFRSKDYPVGRELYGDGLKCWFVYKNVVCGQSMRKLERELSDLFHLHVPKHTYRFKASLAKRYEESCRGLLSELLNGPLLHVDETTVKLKGKSGYVWVFANMDGVYYEYRDSREGKFLHERLSDFAGVLVSDFFTAYDLVSCRQQKCVLHLIRDINDELRRNPFDAELKEMAQDFGELFRRIVLTIDRYGLKRRYLGKHKTEALKYLKKLCRQRPSSEAAEKLQKRLEKYGERLFTFLDNDGIPWNNNNAEHAINLFAKYRRFADGMFTETSIKNHLVLLSVLQTCEYRNLDPLEFLLSGEEQLPK